jgi:hypothetical protein
VLSGSSMAAPSFVAAALGEPAPSHVRVAGRTLYVVRGGAIDRRHVICGLAVTDDDPLSPALLPPGRTWPAVRWKTSTRPGQVRVIAVQRPGAGTVDWSPGQRRLLAPQDRIYVLATRAGLSRVLARSQPVQA